MKQSYFRTLSRELRRNIYVNTNDVDVDDDGDDGYAGHDER